MPLKLEMKMGDRIIINGAVVEVASPHAKIMVLNQAALLRGKEILSEDQAVTPATRVYFALQSAYLFPDFAEKYLEQFFEYVEQYKIACPSAGDIVEKIKEQVLGGQLYKGLKSAQELVGHQQGVLHDFEEKLLEMVDDELEVGAEDLDDGGEPSDMAST
ncbi:MAG: flagellum biosynthesis protein FlbT [Rhodospirillales bacterium]|jgi:flagellar biosynthesis repressor protein FlbT|nr:flagellum biosynthesis protein FlbT [Rhodospirillales bacterium]MBT4039403.1 flagellum biosynthesis protein FlbT [Rhodospirillales bacterium]MBT4627165.1 flagellum biosynthesis protein FlbT [Rhodospirillales bacterium]MBT5352463.1 flagellum biosynthesis protein FlbT [Rhodospirillales bacterium]MBT5519551.1 flagellum biosynthesis protein FlbT [Rhodospirillales bacterium]